MLTIPFLKELENSKRNHSAGEGGGYDVFSGLPLFFGLESLGKEVFLANLSLTLLDHAEEKNLTPNMRKVDADSRGPGFYFPSITSPAGSGRKKSGRFRSIV